MDWGRKGLLGQEEARVTPEEKVTLTTSLATEMDGRWVDREINPFSGGKVGLNYKIPQLAAVPVPRVITITHLVPPSPIVFT